MISVVAFNSAIDRLIDVETLVPGTAMRASRVQAWPGGKGAHAAMCAAALGEPVRLVGFVDAPHRDTFVSWLAERGVEFHPIEMPGRLRTCLALRERDGRITEILEPGPPIDAALASTATTAAAHTCAGATAVILSGSVPAGMSQGTYEGLLSRFPHGRVIVDASGELLRRALAAMPFCVKPNRAEAEALTGERLDSPAGAGRAARTLLSSGCSLAVISLGAEGAVAAWDSHVFHIAAAPVAAVNAVGAGDCLAGGIAVGLARGGTILDALRLGVAAGTAKTLSPETGIVRREHIDSIMQATEATELTRV